MCQHRAIPMNWHCPWASAWLSSQPSRFCSWHVGSPHKWVCVGLGTVGSCTASPDQSKHTFRSAWANVGSGMQLHAENRDQNVNQLNASKVFELYGCRGTYTSYWEIEVLLTWVFLVYFSGCNSVWEILWLLKTNPPLHLAQFWHNVCLYVLCHKTCHVIGNRMTFPMVHCMNTCMSFYFCQKIHKLKGWHFFLHLKLHAYHNLKKVL